MKKPELNLKQIQLTDQKTGTDFISTLMSLKPNYEREDFIYEQFLSGQIPQHLKELSTIKIEYTTAKSKQKKSLEVHVTKDYMSLGVQTDFIRTPIDPLTAQKICSTIGYSLPTTKLVDDIWRASQIKLSPLPWGPPYDASMMSSDRLIKHSRKIDAQLKGFDIGDKLIAGHKKDVVIDNALAKRPNQVAIYGWHKLDSKPIQSLYLGHENTYKDYSHGIRLISREVWLDQQCVDLLDIMTDEDHWPAVSREKMVILLQPEKK